MEEARKMTEEWATTPPPPKAMERRVMIDEPPQIRRKDTNDESEPDQTPSSDKSPTSGKETGVKKRF